MNKLNTTPPASGQEKQQTLDIDRIEQIGNSKIQHGPYNDRLYLMELDREDFPSILPAMEKICAQKGYGKTFAVIPEEFAPQFLEEGYREEARIPGFFQGRQDGLFMGKYHREARAAKPEEALYRFKRIIGNQRPLMRGRLPKGYEYVRLSPSRAGEAAALYGKVFEAYPFPITDPAYLTKTMEEDFLYFGVLHRGKLVAAASAELKLDTQAAEMSDFAVDPAHRGERLGIHLLRPLEEAAKGKGIRTAYTIARLNSIGINTVFKRSGYSYAGTLLNNTRISSGIESMNVWYKTLNRD